MKLIYAGTPEFAATVLGGLLEARHDVALVLTQPDRPAGRGLRPVASAVKRLALERGLAVEQPGTLRDASVQGCLRALEADAMVVAAYGLILPAEVLAIPRHGCLNVHASLLPRWRGAAPIQRAILAGDAETGVSIMQMDAGLDTGPVRLRERVPIESRDTARTLHDRLATLGARLIVQALADMPPSAPQDERLATYAPKIDKQEALLDWRDDATALERKVRAFDPVPGAAARLRGERLKIWAAEREMERSGSPGLVLEASAAGIVIACGRGALRITELQRAGGRRLDAAAFLSGHELDAGTRLDD